MDDKFVDLHTEIKNLLPRRKVESIDDVDDDIVVVIKTGGRAMDIQEERQVKMLIFQMYGKMGKVKVC
ncbi:MAG: hypothetical protein WC560_08920 [Syntrophales bacterium]